MNETLYSKGLDIHSLANIIIPGLGRSGHSFGGEVDFYLDYFNLPYKVKYIDNIVHYINIIKDGVVQHVYSEDGFNLEYDEDLRDAILSIDILEVFYDNLHCKLSVNYSMATDKYTIHKNNFSEWNTIMKPILNRFCASPELLLTDTSILFSGTLEELEDSLSSKFLDYKSRNHYHDMLLKYLDLAKNITDTLFPSDEVAQAFSEFNENKVKYMKCCSIFEDYTSDKMLNAECYLVHAFNGEDMVIDIDYTWNGDSTYPISSDGTFNPDHLDKFECGIDLPDDAILGLPLFRVSLDDNFGGISLDCSAVSETFKIVYDDETEKLLPILSLFTDKFTFDKDITGSYEDIKEWLNQIKHKG